VGWRTLLAAARFHDVWLLTRQNNLESITDALSNSPRAKNVTLVGVDLSKRAMKWKRRLGSIGMQWYYDRWQKRAGVVGAELDSLVNFDVVHHVTLSSYWARVGVAELGKPLVWGPLGGGVNAPLSLYPTLGMRGAMAEIARYLVRPALAWKQNVRTTLDRASVVLAVNEETAQRLRSRAEVVPHATAASLGLLRPGERNNDICFVGRLIPFKGAVLAVRAFAMSASPGNLMIYGSGPERRKVLRLVRKLGLDTRVSVVGAIPRVELLARVQRSRMMLHPSIHEEGSLAIAEALMMGTPLVALARGGPQVLAQTWPMVPVRLVKPASPGKTVRALARAIDELWDVQAPVVTVPVVGVRSFQNDMLEAYERARHDSM
jgi:glycosyltransferase involved in cell wall biosynthesis